MLAMSPRGLGVPVFGFLGMRPFVSAAPLVGDVLVLFLLGGDSLPVSPWAGLFFACSGGWNCLKMSAASL